MSKIHEALKKAQLEREAILQGTTGTVTSENLALGAAPSEAVVPAVASDGSAISEREQVPVQKDFLRLELLQERCTKPTWKIDPAASVFSGAHAPNGGAEQFRTLRSRLYRLREIRPIRSLLVTSPLAGDGKTFVASNLAQAIARQRDQRVLLIDGDLRCSKLHEPLGAPKVPGLSNYLRGEADEFAIIQHGAKDNLCFIPGGDAVPDPAELIAGVRLRNLLERLAPVFEWTIIDSPPVLPVSDATLLADLCDGVLMVVRAGVTNFDATQRACQEFRERNLLGVILNGADQNHSYDAYHYAYDSGRNRKRE